MPKHLGLATGYQMAEWLDCLTCIRICCQTCLSPSGEELPQHWAARIESIPSGKHSIAKIVRTLKLWRKWTHAGLTPQYVQGFLWDVSK